MEIIIGILAVLTAVSVYIGNWRRQKKRHAEQALEKEERDHREKELAKAWERILPGRILSLLHLRGAGEVMAGLYTTTRGMALAVKIPSETRAFVQMDAQRQMDFLSRMYQTIYPVLERTGCAGETGDQVWLDALYTENPAQAVKAGIGICGRLQEMGENELYEGISMGLAFGVLAAGTFGTSVRVMPTLLFKTDRISRFLAKKAPKYGTKILAAQETAEQIPEFFRRFHVRCLGYFYHEKLEMMIKVYDIYDGDRISVRQKKMKTGILFEQGVELYGKRDYGEARRAFAEVLKADREDAAAGIYLSQCDRCAKIAGEKQRADIPLWIEGGW